MAEAAIDSPDAEVVNEENRSIMMSLISQLKIGMDLSKVTLPTFVLESRSMLQKLTDFYTYGELLKDACHLDDPMARLVGLVKWYCAGFSLKPKGVKKPYNPILGEWFRCKWTHPSDGSTTFYVAEQVSHHPPISCFLTTNRKAGFVINGCVRPKSKYFGNSSAAMLEGGFTIHILKYNETYELNFPTYYVRGILFGTLLMEICGMINIRCVQTGASAEIEFKAKPFFGGEYNSITGKIRNQKKDIVYTLSGYWDKTIEIHRKEKKDKNTPTTEVLWQPGLAVPLKMDIPSLNDQEPFESMRLWKAVTEAIHVSDQTAATEAKSQLEQDQRERIRTASPNDFLEGRFFKPDAEGNWKYKWLTLHNLDPDEEPESEVNGIVATNKTRPQASAPSQ